MNISDIPTCDLVEELIKRDGVDFEEVASYQGFELSVNGPAVVVVVYD